MGSGTEKEPLCCKRQIAGGPWWEREGTEAVSAGEARTTGLRAHTEGSGWGQANPGVWSLLGAGRLRGTTYGEECGDQTVTWLTCTCWEATHMGAGGS